MKLIAATLFLNEPRMVVYVEDAAKVRRIESRWFAVGPESGLPPKAWAEAVRGEVEYRKSTEQSPSASLMRFSR